MKETYNTSRIKELVEGMESTRTKWRKQLNIQDDRQAIRYIEGGDMHVSRLLQIAASFGVSVAEFFNRGDIRLDRAIAMETANHEPDDVKALRLELKHTKEMMEVKMGYERRIGELSKEIEMLKEECERLKQSTPTRHPDSYIDKTTEEKEVHLMAAES